MFKIILAMLLFSLIAVMTTNHAFATDTFTLKIHSLHEFKEGQYPFVNGETLTLNKTPVSDVQVRVVFPLATIDTITNSIGQFSATSPIPAEVGEYTITVYVKKDNRYTDSQVKYIVKSKPVSVGIPDNATKYVDVSQQSDKVIAQNPLAKTILQHVEDQKTNYVKQKIVSEEQKIIDKQRVQSQVNLQKDMKSFETENEINTPRNAFLRFLADFDNSIKSIFWDQFLFTEKLTQQAQDAKEKALDEGKSPLEATKIFQKNAEVTRNDVIDYNKKLNIKYGNATSDIQKQFDEKGKLPRTDD